MNWWTEWSSFEKELLQPWFRIVKHVLIVLLIDLSHDLYKKKLTNIDPTTSLSIVDLIQALQDHQQQPVQDVEDDDAVLPFKTQEFEGFREAIQ